MNSTHKNIFHNLSHAKKYKEIDIDKLYIQFNAENSDLLTVKH